MGETRTVVDPLAGEVSARPGSEACAADRLVVARVSRRFGAGSRSRRVLADVTLRVPRGRFVSIVGPSGCGKSTLLRIVAGLLEPDSGSVAIFGEAPHEACARKHVGFLAQSPALLPWRSALDNVRLGLEVNRRARREGSGRNPRALLEVMGLGAVADRRPAELSGGMQQRVALARALAFEPTLLLMDEPFSALDELTRERLRHELLRLWEADQKTVLFVTHSVTEAVLLSDAVVVMGAHPGRLRALVQVDLPRPRDAAVESSDAFLAIERAVRAELAANERDDP